MNKFVFFLAVFSFLLFSSFCDHRMRFDWSAITEVRGYGNIDPDQNPYSGYLSADVEMIKRAFKNVERVAGELPEGAARYATVKMSFGWLKLKIITGRPLAFKVISNRREMPGWYEPQKALLWEEAREVKKLQSYRAS